MLRPRLARVENQLHELAELLSCDRTASFVCVDAVYDDQIVCRNYENVVATCSARGVAALGQRDIRQVLPVHGNPPEISVASRVARVRVRRRALLHPIRGDDLAIAPLTAPGEE